MLGVKLFVVSIFIRMKFLPRITFLLFFWALSVHLVSATKYYVDSDGSDLDGSSWANAYKSIQSAINVAVSGDTIWVKSGIYYSDDTDETVSITIPSGVLLFGGFTGEEASIDDRALSDIDGDSITEAWEFTNATVIDGEIQQDGTDSNNTQHIIKIASGASKSTTLNGFTIRNGYSDGYSSGVYIYGGTISSCIIQDCMAYNSSADVYGGGLYAENATVKDVLIKDCSLEGKVVAGGGAYINNVVMTGCSVTGCSGSLLSSGTKGYGGGVYASGASHILNTKISNCSTEGTYSNTGGGGLYLIGSSTAMNVIVYNCEADAYAGGVYNLSSYFVNGVVVNNHATGTSASGGGAYTNSEAVFYNTVFWGNSSASSSQVSSYGEKYNCAIESSNSGTNTLTLSSSNSGSDVDTNYPAFVNPTSFVGTSGGDETKDSKILLADWNIEYSSSLIEAGTEDGLSEALVGADLDGNGAKTESADDFTDMAGEDRLFNYNQDIGAYEIVFLDWTLPDSPTIEYGDTLKNIVFTGDTVVDLRTTQGVAGEFYFVDSLTIPPYSEDSIKYQVVFEPDDTGTYANFYDSVAVTVTPKELTLTGYMAEDKVYDGTTAVTFVSDGTTSALVGLVDENDDVSFDGIINAAEFEDKNVGTDKNIVFNEVTLSGTDASNYTLAKLEATASITAKSASITIDGVEDKVYDGTTTAYYTVNSTISGVIDGDIVSVDPTNVSVDFEDENVGANKTVSFAGFALTGVDAGNYVLDSQPSSTTASITALEVSISGVGAEDKAYDGTTSASISGSATLLSTISDDDVAIDSSSATAVFSDKNVGVDKTVSFSGYTLSGSDASNYTISQPDNTIASITAKSITITGVSIDDKEYDATTDAVLSGTPSLSGVVSGDDVTVTGDGTATFADANAGTSKIVNVSGYSISGTDAANYTLVEDSYTATINPVAIVLVADDASKTYGEDDPDLTYVISSGSLVSDDNFEGSITRTSGEDAGSYDITQGSLTLSDNYSITFTTGTFTIYKASNSISFTLESPMTYESGLVIDLSDYATATSGEYVVFAISSEDIATLSGTELTINNYGSVDITASEDGDNNYEAATPVTLTLTINPDATIVRKGSNMLLIDNSEGYFYSYSDSLYQAGGAYQWYQNGNIITGATKQYYYNENGLSGEYYCMVVTRTGYSYNSNSITIASTQSLNVYPAPVSAGESFSVDLKGFGDEGLDSETLEIYSVSGILIQKLNNVSESQTMNIQEPGVYIIKATGSNLSKRVIVK